MKFSAADNIIKQRKCHKAFFSKATTESRELILNHKCVNVFAI